MVKKKIVLKILKPGHTEGFAVPHPFYKLIVRRTSIVSQFRAQAINQRNEAASRALGGQVRRTKQHTLS